MNININKEGPKGLLTQPSEIDKYIKVKVLGEAITLVKNHTKEQVLGLKKYKGWEKLLPDPELTEYQTFSLAKKIFDKLAGQTGQNLSISKFSKLSKVPGMVSDKVLKPHYDIIFKRTLS
jgi:hypothetical protein